MRNLLFITVAEYLFDNKDDMSRFESILEEVALDRIGAKLN
jgi:hypothetical protein